MKRIKWIFTDFDSFAIMDGSGFNTTNLAFISTSRLPSPLESPDSYREGVRISASLFSLTENTENAE
jgi:hypothetical protein